MKGSPTSAALFCCFHVPLSHMPFMWKQVATTVNADPIESKNQTTLMACMGPNLRAGCRQKIIILRPTCLSIQMNTTKKEEREKDYKQFRWMNFTLYGPFSTLTVESCQQLWIVGVKLL